MGAVTIAAMKIPVRHLPLLVLTLLLAACGGGGGGSNDGDGSSSDYPRLRLANATASSTLVLNAVGLTDDDVAFTTGNVAAGGVSDYQQKKSGLVLCCNRATCRVWTAAGL